MSFLTSLFNRKEDRAALRPLYASVVETARQPHWYLEGGVPDTLDGRFDMVAAVLALVLLRLEALDAQTQSVKVTEIFIDDMDGQIREIGFGDVVVGKQVGRMVGALGGRLAAYRAGLSGAASLSDALVRNLYRGQAPSGEELAFAEGQLRALDGQLAGLDLPALMAGHLGG